jgi:hypothetical protein
MLPKKRLVTGKVLVTFKFQAPPGCKQVHLAGEFNAWDKQKHPLQPDGSGCWTIQLELDDEHSYAYRFLVDGAHWHNDPLADGTAPNQHGGQNSLVRLYAIKHPYARTPYDVLSEPDDPKIGEFTPQAPQSQVHRQQALLVARRKKDGSAAVQAISLAARALGYPDRVHTDAFLVSTLSATGDLDALEEHVKKEPLPPPRSEDWTGGLHFWLEPPEVTVQLEEIQISGLERYEDPRSDLRAVDFDR